MSTLSELIQKTIKRLSQVPGKGTQLFAEDKIAEIIQDTFDMVMAEAWWPNYMKWTTFVLDGTTGVSTTNLGVGDTSLTAPIKDFGDIRVIHRDKFRKLVQTPLDVQPSLLSGTTPIYMEALFDNDEKVVQVWPATATGTLYMHARIHPGMLTADTEIRLDDTLLINGAAWDFMEDDGANPSASAKFQTKFEARLKQMKKKMDNVPIQLGPSADIDIPDQWFVT